MAGSTTETENYSEDSPAEPVAAPGDTPGDTREEPPEETTRSLAEGKPPLVGDKPRKKKKVLLG